MCGRYTLRHSESDISEAFAALGPELDLAPRFNIAPTQDIVVVRSAAGEEAGRELVAVRWGLLPGWVKDPDDFPTLINARAESAPSKPSFREAFRRRRCLIPADGFYEWRKMPDGKQPWFIHREDDGLFAFAGLWERWERDDRRLDSATILTTSPGALLERLHDRMPAILPAESWSAWLDADLEAADAGRLVGSHEEGLEAIPVSRYVNSPAHDDPGCILAAEPGG